MNASTLPDVEQARFNMVEQQIRPWDVLDANVLQALFDVRREQFVPPALRALAFSDLELPLEINAVNTRQTMLAPKVEARLAQELQLSKSDCVLEIGTGSGYQTAVLAELAGEVFTVERLPELSREAQRRLTALGYRNVKFKVGDGTKGWPEEAPFSAILVTAAAPQVPPSLVDQLAEGGRLVIPLGGRTSQDLWLLIKRKGRLEREYLCPCTFVPLIGEEGWR